MVGIDDVSMNIIDDDHTPVRATAAAQGVNVARASVQLPDPLCSHWQTDLNRFVASLSIPPKASFPDLLGKLKASEGKYRSVEEKLKATEQQAFISVSNAEKTLSSKTAQYFCILGGWEKQFKEKMAQLGRKRGEAETEIAVAREEHAAKLKGVLDEAALLKGELASARARNESLVAEKMRHISEERRNNRSNENLKGKLAATRTRVEVVNHSYENLKAKSVSELEENILVLERVEADATALWSSHAATVALLEEANCRNEHLEKENSAAREELMRKVEEANCSNENLKAESVLEMERVKAELEEANCNIENFKAESVSEMERVKAELEEANHSNENLKAVSVSEMERIKAELEEVNRSNENLKAKSVSEMERVKAELEEANRSNENLKADSVSEMERIKAELEEAVILSDLRSNHVLTLAFERNQAKTELERLLLERNTTNAEVLDVKSLIPSPTEFGDSSGLLKRTFKELKYPDNVPPQILAEISKMIFKVNPVVRICIIIKHHIFRGFVELQRLGYDCPPNNDETIEQLLGATIEDSARSLLCLVKKIMSKDVWNGLCCHFQLDHITPKDGAFSMNRSLDFWNEMTINHLSNLHIIPAQINNVEGNQLISVMEKTFDSDGKFVRWEHVSHNVKQIHDAAEFMKKECHSFFHEWRMKGVERILFNEANKRTGGLHVYNFDKNNMDDDMHVS